MRLLFWQQYWRTCISYIIEKPYLCRYTQFTDEHAQASFDTGVYYYSIIGIKSNVGSIVFFSVVSNSDWIIYINVYWHSAYQNQNQNTLFIPKGICFGYRCSVQIRNRNTT